MAWARWAILLLVMWAAPGGAAAQTVVKLHGADGAVRHETLPAGARFALAAAGDSLAAVLAYDPDAEVAVIVQFAHPPLSRVGGAGPGKAAQVAAAQAAMDRERADFARDVAALVASKQPGALPLDVRFDLRTAFNGLALTTRRWALAHLATLPYVRYVYADATVRTLDEESNRRVGADRVWEDLGATGRGVRLAVIDTGVDYSHPDLGGGFGPGFKVAGGYDFADDDGDPMDLNGHGTHVAAIAAADGGLRGVAPGAEILAVRVLDAAGAGASSAVLAGLDYALDPDGDPLTADAADVINLSLGFAGSPFHPLAQAVENAVAGGTVCVVAAGNGGSYHEILVPATAEAALTVGASDADDEVARFSARGPTGFEFANKPDLVAPGVEIESAALGGGRRRLSGTSMAAPHVAGAVALLMELHPSWTPALIKAALVQHATDLGEDVWTQGAGRLDVRAAATPDVVATPSTISLGLLDLEEETISVAEPITIHNPTSTTQTFTFGVEKGTLPDEFRVDRDDLEIAAGGTATVTLHATLTPASLESRRIAPPSYAGRVEVRGATTTLRIPVTFVKTEHLALTFDRYPPVFLMAHDGERVVAALGERDLLGAAAAPLPLPPGTYDVIALFDVPNKSHEVVAVDVREQIDLATKTRLTLRASRGVNSLRHRLRDADGLEFEPDFTLARLVFDQGRVTFDVGLPGHFDHLNVSQTSERYQVDMVFQSFGHPSGADYVVPYSTGAGVRRHETFHNEPSALRRHDTQFHVPPGTTQLTFAPDFYNTPPEATPHRSTFLAFDRLDLFRIPPPFRHTVYYAPGPPGGSSYGYHSFAVYDTSEDGTPSFLGGENKFLETALAESTPATLQTVRSVTYPLPLRRAAGPVLETVASLGPPFWMGRFANQRNWMQLRRGDYAPLFANPGGDTFLGGVFFEVFADGERLRFGGRSNANTNSRLSLRNLDLGAAYEAVFVYDRYAIQGAPGVATARLAFRLDADAAVDANPPTLALLRLDAHGVTTDAFAPGPGNRITFVAHDVDASVDSRRVASAELFYRMYGSGKDWQRLTPTRAGDLFFAHWPAGLPEGYYSLRIRLADAAGHTLDYTAAPALLLGTPADAPPAPFALTEPAHDAEVSTDAPIRFAWEPSTDPEGAPLSYSLHLTGPSLDSTLTAGAATSLDVDLRGRLHLEATYRWHVEASDGTFTIPALRARTFHTSPTATATEDPADLPDAATLEPNFPNPFTGATTISFALPRAEAVRLEVFDVLGRRVAVLADGRWPAGRHRLTWHAGTSPPGVYFTRLTAGTSVRVRPLTRAR